MRAEVLEIFDDLLADFSDASVLCEIKYDANTTISTKGIISRITSARTIVSGGIAEDIDSAVLITADSVPDVGKLNGRMIAITKSGEIRTYRIVGTDRDQVGATVKLLLADTERVRQ